jgi:hypothetical protein
MRWSDIPRNPSDRLLRQFAGLCLLFFGGMAAWRAWRQGPSPVVYGLAALALGLGIVGLIRPRAIRPVFVGWMMLAYPIGWLISNAVLALMYYGIITPLGLAFRLAGRDVLRRKRPRDAATYWAAKPTPADVRRYFQQY